jgi:hypothetical protein
MASSSGMALDAEVATYLAHLPELLDREGQFVLVRGQEICGVYLTYEDALRAGYERLQLQPFLVKEIEAFERPEFISRLAEFDSPTGT